MLAICRVLVIAGLLLEIFVATSRGQTLQQQPGCGLAKTTGGDTLIFQSQP